jgi:uncharacterized membrane protein (TIGR02234 family)
VNDGRRLLSVAVALTAAGAALLLLAAGRPWAHVALHQPPPLPTRRVDVTGADLSGLVRALGLVALAGAAALYAVAGPARRALGALLVAVGGAAVLSLGLSAPAHVRDAGAVQSRLPSAARVTVEGRTGWPVVFALGGAAVAAAGALTTSRGAGWPRLGARYDAPVALRPRPRDPWSALDRGEDPTA